MAQIRSNLDHLSKIFPLSPSSPSLVCDHCLHCTDQNCALEVLSSDNFEEILMATDHSCMAVMDKILDYIGTDIQKEVNIWALEEDTRRKNSLKPKLREDTDCHYATQLAQIQQLEEA